MNPTALLALGVASVGAAAPLIRMTHAPPLTAAFLRTLMGGLVLLAIVLVRRTPMPSARDRWRALACGALLGVHFALWFVSLQMTTVAASTVLVCLQPVFVAGLALVFLGERTPARGIVGIIVALAGAVAIALDGTTGTAPAPDPLTGNALALAGAVVVAFYPIVARRQDPRTDLLAFSAWVALSAAGTLGVVALAFGSPLVVADASWPALVLLALIPTVVGQTALNAAIRHLPASVVAGAILGEPVIAALAAAVILNEIPGGLTLAGSAVVLAGLSLVVVRARASVPGGAVDP